MKQKIYQVDAFAQKLFEGNPAAVCIMKSWPGEDWMQNVAMENNLAETAFVVPNNGVFEIRWFTPKLEVDLCGHATLAAAFVLFHYEGVNSATIEFNSIRSGPLGVEKRTDGRLILDFPEDAVVPVPKDEALIKALGREPATMYKGKTDYLLVYNRQDEIEAMQPDFLALSKIGARGVIMTAPGIEMDFVSRFFAPQSGVDEDPVTGSAHTTLVPYWSGVLNKTKLSARQLSARGGNLYCEYQPPRVKIAGKAVLYLIGEIEA